MPFALALLDSLRAQNEGVTLHALISDKSSIQHETPENLEIYFAHEICTNGIGRDLLEKYGQEYHDEFRWSLKPVFLSHLIKTHAKAIYVDSDVHFFNSFDFLFEKLDECDYLLSPHFRSSDPLVERENFFLQNYAGLYNGGFLAVNNNASDGLNWWAKTCLEICIKDKCKGQHDDQAHLNLLPIFFNKVHILKHRGCNVANWNQIECIRSIKDNEVVINDEFSIVFIHFTMSTIRGILKGEDPLLLDHLKTYDKNLIEHGRSGSYMDIELNPPATRPSLLTRMRRKIHRLTKD